jgi:hypothetical protein
MRSVAHLRSGDQTADVPRETQSGTPEDRSAAAAKLSPFSIPGNLGVITTKSGLFRQHLSIASVLRCAGHFRYFSNSGGKSDGAALRTGANKGHIARARFADKVA